MNTCMDPLSHNSNHVKLLLLNDRPTLGLRPAKGAYECNKEKKNLLGFWLGNSLGTWPKLIRKYENILSTLGKRSFQMKVTLLI